MAGNHAPKGSVNGQYLAEVPSLKNLGVVAKDGGSEPEVMSGTSQTTAATT